MYTEPGGGLEHSVEGRDAQALIRRCVHCGFCLEACPTYRVLGDERDGPRGRIYLIKQLVEGKPAGETTRHHLDRCLGCRACESACPSGVQYGQLLDIGRAVVERRTTRPLRERLWRNLLVSVLSDPRVFAVVLRFGQELRPLLSRRLAAVVPARAARGVWPAPRHARRMAVLEGCVQPALAPDINAAAARVLDRTGISLLRVAGATCCGALAHHLGHRGRALDDARRTVDAGLAVLDAGVEAIVSTASGCGVMVKDYGRLLRDDPPYAAKARRLSAATRDLCEVITPADLERAGLAAASPATIAWQAPCTLQHGLKLNGLVEPLLATVGYRLLPVADPQLCCGSAGSYSILERELADELRARKLATLERGGPRLIATANIGCLQHLSAAAQVPVRHWIELIDAATALPEALTARGAP